MWYTAFLVILLIPLVAFVGIFGLLLARLVKTQDAYQTPAEFPKISVLLAARNEESNILECLEALNQLDYPREKLEILVGNDRSEDATRSIVEDYIQGKPHFRLVDVEWEWGLARSKANALAWLANEANGEFYFSTDADIRVPPSWIKGLLPYFQENVGIVSGVSVVFGKKFFGRMQGLEWLYYMVMLRVVAGFYPVTAIGNNMAVRARAYWDTGGYQNIPSSVTEDYKLFQQVTRLGWQHRHVMNVWVLGRSEPAPSLQILLQQRKRWMRGGTELPFSMWALMLVHGLFVPFVLILLFLQPYWALGFIGIQWVLQSLFLAISGPKLQYSVKGYDLFLFEPYHYFTALMMPLYYFWPVKLKWKEREV